MDESAPRGGGFLAELCEAWEAATAGPGDARVVNIRTGLVLSAKGGLYGTLRPLFQLCLGGRLGDGRQFMPWIALEDEVGAIVHVLTHDDLSGPVNLTGPGPGDQRRVHPRGRAARCTGPRRGGCPGSRSRPCSARPARRWRCSGSGPSRPRWSGPATSSGTGPWTARSPPHERSAAALARRRRGALAPRSSCSGLSVARQPLSLDVEVADALHGVYTRAARAGRGGRERRPRAGAPLRPRHGAARAGAAAPRAPRPVRAARRRAGAVPADQPGVQAGLPAGTPARLPGPELPERARGVGGEHRVRPAPAVRVAVAAAGPAGRGRPSSWPSCWRAACRVVLGVHWVTDTIGAVLAVTGVGLLSACALRLLPPGDGRSLDG